MVMGSHPDCFLSRIFGYLFQDALFAKEEAKINRKRELYEQRRVRILNAKVRLIGLDVQALNSQVEEKQRQRETEKEEDRYASKIFFISIHHPLLVLTQRSHCIGAQALEIERLLAGAQEEERQMREFQMSQIKQSWEDSKRFKEEEINRPKGKDFDVENAGPASALRFFGEDTNRPQRHRLQKQQMQQWIQEQVAEKAHLRHLGKLEEMSYAEMLRAIDEVRDAAEREEREMRQYIQETVKQYNRDLAARQRDRNRDRDAINPDGKTSLDLFDENKATALNATGRIIRPDMFKGFTEEQRQRILLDNQKIIQDRNARLMAEKQEEYDNMIQQLLALRAMEQAEFDEKSMRNAAHQEHLDYLKFQMDQQARDRAEWDRTKYGEVRGGFFDGFGKSCR